MLGLARAWGFPTQGGQRIRATIAVLAAITAATMPDPAEARRGCQTRSCEQRVASRQCSQTRVVPCIRHAAMRYRQSFHGLLRVARCESTLNPYAVGFSIHHGLFQFLPSTWQTTPYRRRWIYSARAQSLAAAWMWSRGRRGEWACR